MTNIVMMELRFLEDGIYKISKALVEFTKKGYDPGGIDEAIEMAERYVKRYEEDHPEVNHGKET